MPYIRIGFADYELCPVEPGDKSLLLGSQVCVGLVDHYSHTISYQNDLAGQMQLQTILHESLHVADWQAGDSDRGEAKESAMDRYANFFLQFARDNREVIQLIWEIADTTRKVEKPKKPKPKKKGA